MPSRLGFVDLAGDDRGGWLPSRRFRIFFEKSKKLTDGFVSVFTGDENKKLLYVVISAAVLLGLGYLIKSGVFKRKKKKKRNKVATY